MGPAVHIEAIADHIAQRMRDQCAEIFLRLVKGDHVHASSLFDEKVDHAVDTMKNGGKEPVSDKIEDAAHDARDGVKDAVDDVKKN